MTELLNKNASIGIFGSGQLGMMFAERAIRHGHKVISFSDSYGPIVLAGAELIVGKYENLEAIQNFVDRVDIVTFEFENIPSETLKFLKQFPSKIFPNPNSIAIAQDRVLEKSLFQELHLPTPKFFAFSSEDFPKEAPLPFPFLAKTRKFGYDGKGQFKILNQQNWKVFYSSNKATDFILEEVIPFQREVSSIAVRFRDGKTKLLAIAENKHKNHILDTSIFPCNVENPNFLEEATTKIADKLDYCGVFAIEFFIKDQNFYLNEMAPRPHNSGHFSQDAGTLSQFDLQLFSILGYPSFDFPKPNPTVMKNLVGDEFNNLLPLIRQLTIDPRYQLHVYGKSEVKVGRKMGHVNFKGKIEEVDERLL